MAVIINDMDKPINCRWCSFRQGSDEDNEIPIESSSFNVDEFISSNAKLFE